MKPVGFWLSITTLAAFLAGCHGIPTASEKAAREQQRKTASLYRPQGSRPALPVLTPSSPLSNYLAYAMLNQPKVEAAYYDWLASIERITTARSLPDPQITFQMDIQSIVTSVMPGFMLAFPGLGKLNAAAAVASAESEAKYFAFQSAVLDTAFDLKRSYYGLYFLQDKIRITRDTLTLLAELESLARAQNEVGKVTLQDVLRAQIEQDRLRSDLANLEDSRDAFLAEFKASLGLTADAPAPPVPLTFESTPLDSTTEKNLAMALVTNKRVRALSAAIRAADAAVAAAYKARNPDFTLGLMADVKMNPVLYRPLGTLTLPIWRDKIMAQIAEAQANKRAAEARLSSAQLSLAVEFADKTFTYREATRNLTLLRNQLLPKQRQSFEVARSGYLAGQIDFFNLTDAEQSLLRFALAEVEARAQRELALAELSLIIEGMGPTGASSWAGGNMNGATGTSARASSPSGAGMK
jgi:cobalt-zinc-cadmium efflux system outer membrane protein